MLEGLPLTEGASLGAPDGWLDGEELGSPDMLGLSLGIEVGQSETEGL